ncbi:MAG: MFS transporter [Pseudomonadota bacterium]
MWRSLAVLFVAQLFSVSGSVSLVQLGGLVGLELSPRRDLATLPLSLMVIGTAVATLLAAALMKRIGRRWGFCVGASVASLAMLGSAVAAAAGSFVGLCAGATAFGVSLAFTQQFRFAAAESVSTERAPIAIGGVLFGSIGGAILGPQLSNAFAAESVSATAAAVFAALSALTATSAILFALVYPSRPSGCSADDADLAPAVTASLWRRPAFLIAVLGGAASYGVMTLVMTATPISMHAHHGHSLATTGFVITSHVIAMYLPSIATGAVITRFGATRVMIAGVIALAASLAVGWAGQSVPHYWTALVLLGLGWNFLFVGATSQLTTTYRPAERYKAQAINDFCVFGTAAAASLASGAVLFYIGWVWLMLVPLPLLVVVGVVLARGPQPSRYRPAMDQRSRT